MRICAMHSLFCWAVHNVSSCSESVLSACLRVAPADGRCASAEENSAGLAIAEMNDAYSRETLALKQEVESYVNTDPYDPERPKIVAVRATA